MPFFVSFAFGFGTGLSVHPVSWVGSIFFSYLVEFIGYFLDFLFRI